jgi:hypothetical protein
MLLSSEVVFVFGLGTSKQTVQRERGFPNNIAPLF